MSGLCGIFFSSTSLPSLISDRHCLNNACRVNRVACVFLHYIATEWKLRMLEADSRADGVLKIQSFIDHQNF